MCYNIVKTINKEKKMFQTNLSALALGTAPFGTGISRETAFTILDAYIGRGGNLIDTAAVYGMGLSEQTIGDWVSDRGIRYNITIATKGGHPSIPDWNRRITEKDICFDIENSLRYLKTDYIDIYFLHRDDEDQPVENIMPILDRLARMCYNSDVNFSRGSHIARPRGIGYNEPSAGKKE